MRRSNDGSATFSMLSQGRAFVLFTSYSLLQNMAGRLQAFCARNGWELLVQGAANHATRSFASSARTFRVCSSAPKASGPASMSPARRSRMSSSHASPSPSPITPLTAARLEAIEERGGNPFMEYSVPEAVLKLRQGVGRLIRTKKDGGIAVILDNRVLTKQYGRIFLDALPPAPREIVREAGK